MSYSSPGYSSSIEESKKRDIFVDEYFLHFDGLYPIKFDTINTIFLEQDWTESFFKSRTNKIEGINNRHLIISFLKYKNGFEKRWSLSHESNSFYSIIMNHHYLCISRINFKDTIPLIYTDLETKESQKAWLIKKE